MLGLKKFTYVVGLGLVVVGGGVMAYHVFLSKSASPLLSTISVLLILGGVIVSFVGLR